MTSEQERGILIPKFDGIHDLIRPEMCTPEQLKRLFADRVRMSATGYEVRLAGRIFYVNVDDVELFRVGDPLRRRSPVLETTPGGLTIQLYNEITKDGIIRAYTRASNIMMSCGLETRDAMMRRGM